MIVTGPSVTLQFVLGKGSASSAIAWFSQGHFSHVDAVLLDGTLLGARSDFCGGQRPGVRIRPPNYEPWLKVTRFNIPCTEDQYKVWDTFLRGQLGKPYDHRAIFAFAFDRNWREEDAWICSELQAKALEVSAIVKPLYLAANKITPVMGAMVASAIQGSTYEDFL